MFSPDSSLPQSLVRTLALFAAQNHAATLVELQTLLIRVAPYQEEPATLSAILSELEGTLKDKVASRDGLYAPRGYEQLLDNRLAQYNQTLALYRKARRYERLLRHIPFVRSVALSGSVAQLNADDSSDIDLFIIAQPGRIFTARLLVSALFQLTASRRHGRKIAGRFCLNHYVAAGLAVPQDRNLYTALLYTSFIPLFGELYTDDFWQNNLSWIREFFIKPQQPKTNFFNSERSGSVLQRFLEAILSPIAPGLERLCRIIQERRIKQGEYVIVTPDQLAFHPDSKGQRILARYEAVLSGLPRPTKA